jgi:hypothetical protein
MNSINKTSEILLEEIQLENQIRNELNETTLYFDYTETDELTELSLITISKSHGERFLFHKVKNSTKQHCLINMLEYIRSDYKKNFQTYEIIWKRKSGTEDIKSWFCGKSFIDIIDKFYHLKETNEVIVYSVTLKPQS